MATRHVRRSVLRAGMLGAGAALASACGAGGGGTAGEQAGERGRAAAKAPVTVEYWTFWRPSGWTSCSPHLPAFEQRTRYVKATLSQVGDFRPKLRTAIVAGTPPDASIGDVFSAALYDDQQVLLHLDTRLKRDRIDLRRDYVLNGFEYWCGSAYAFPLDGFSMALVYNKTMFRERGVPDPWDVQKGQWTWDDFVARADQAHPRRRGGLPPRRPPAGPRLPPLHHRQRRGVLRLRHHEVHCSTSPRRSRRWSGCTTWRCGAA